ncbi:MAG: thiolase family protein [Actinobacteria bacterium]|jgi:acetyl-CoA acetyltransferase|nr:MAG: thiolase family protein [Actinomycetota bacterium]
MEDVYIIGVGMFRFGKYPEKSIKQMTAEVVDNMLADCPVEKKDIEAAWYSNSFWGIVTGQHSIRGQVALTPLGIEGIPVMNVENACAGATSAVNGAYLGIRAGAYDVAMAIGVEKMYNPDDKQAMFEMFMSNTDVEFIKGILAAFQADMEKKAAEAGTAGEGDSGGGGGGGRSPFMDIYAMAARMHMDRYGTTQRQLAMIAAKNHYHASLNPLAQYQMDMTVEEVLNDRPVAYPLTRSMCAPMGDGATAALLCSGKALKKFAGARPVKILASVLTSGSIPAGGAMDLIGERLSRKAYEVAGLGAEDVDVAEVHDATAFGELLQCEELGFCGEGEGGPFAESGATKLGGKLPVNTSGGLECRGHPIGASGIAQLVELVTQLRGEAGKRQVEGARIAMAENGGGFIGTGEAAMCIHILQRAV